jgi:hypothetical protein
MQRVACLLQPVHRQLHELLLLIEPIRGDQRLHGGIDGEAVFRDDEGMGLPWMPTRQLYTSSISFDFSFIQSWGGLSENLDISKVTAKPTLSD